MSAMHALPIDASPEDVIRHLNEAVQQQRETIAELALIICWFLREQRETTIPLAELASVRGSMLRREAVTWAGAGQTEVEDGVHLTLVKR